ncbi:MAG TPA: anthrone oxygenase family protein [Microlunatus sp.]
MNPVFMLPFLGSFPLLGMAVVIAWRTPGRPALAWLIAALVCYLIAFMVTGGINVPLNDQLANAGDADHIRNLAATRSSFESQWVAWNIVRAVLHTAGFVCMIWALMLLSADRSGQTENAATAAAPPSRVMLSLPPH